MKLINLSYQKSNFWSEKQREGWDEIVAEIYLPQFGIDNSTDDITELVKHIKQFIEKYDNLEYTVYCNVDNMFDCLLFSALCGSYWFAFPVWKQKYEMQKLEDGKVHEVPAGLEFAKWRVV